MDPKKWTAAALNPAGHFFDIFRRCRSFFRVQLSPAGFLLYRNICTRFFLRARSFCWLLLLLFSVFFWDFSHADGGAKWSPSLDSGVHKFENLFDTTKYVQSNRWPPKDHCSVLLLWTEKRNEMFFLLQIVKFEVENFGIFSSWGQTSEFWQKWSHDPWPWRLRENPFSIVFPPIRHPPFFCYLRLFKNVNNCGALNKAIKRPALLGGHIFPQRTKKHFFLFLNRKKVFYLKPNTPQDFLFF